MHAPEAKAIQLLKDNIPGLKRVVPGTGEGIDFIGVLPKGQLMAQVHALATLRIADLEGRLARSILQFARARPRKGEHRLILVSVPRAGKRALEAAARFMGLHAPNIGWGVFGSAGETRLVIPALNVDVNRRVPGDARPLPSRRSGRLFTDLNCWMLKILLLRDAPKGMWGGPRVQVESPQDLHRAAGVSRELAYRFTRAFEAEGFLRKAPAGIVVARRQALLEAWFYDQQLTVVRRIPVRWILGKPEKIQDAFKAGGGAPDFAIAGFAACRLLGALHTVEPRVEIHVLGALEDALAAWSLEPCHERDAHFLLVQTRFGQSILRGRVWVDKLPVADVLQAALDVASQPARGREQAQYIIEHVLGWKNE